MERILIVIISISLTLMSCAGETKNIDTSNVSTIGDENLPRLPIPTDAALKKTVKDNLDGLNNEDLVWAIEPLHMNSPYMDDPAYHIRGSILVYEMQFDLVSVEIESKSETECVALVVHNSRNDNERTYEPQQQKQRYTWRPDGDKWKIWKMEVIGSTPLHMLN